MASKPQPSPVISVPRAPDYVSANFDFTNIGVVSSNNPAATLTPGFYPIVLPGVTYYPLDSIMGKITALESAKLLGAAIYQITYTGASTFTANLTCQVNAALSGSANGIVKGQVTTGAAGSGATVPVMLDLTKQYIIGGMVDSIATLRTACLGFNNSYVGVNILKWSAAARSSPTDWPSSFTQASVTNTGTTQMHWFGLLTATGTLSV